ncbi:MAG: phytoene/squalene synthase family protein [Phycisphaerae bacterium]|nr:phytoene/squalene synthase family protein [Phycisphaerae bacterium]
MPPGELMTGVASMMSEPANSAPPVVRSADLDASFRYCARVTRGAARNFYHGLRLLPRPRRKAMFALYAYMRRIDDIADSAECDAAKIAAEIESWRQKTRLALSGDVPPDESPLWPALMDTVRAYGLPAAILEEALDGQAQDASHRPFENSEELRRYCRRVAGTVGVATVMIFGNRGGEEALRLAEGRGIAFQITNILRDVREDAGRGRCYLPLDALAREGLSADCVLEGRSPEQVARVVAAMCEFAAGLFSESKPLDAMIEDESRPAMRALTGLYREILMKIEADPARVLRERVSLAWHDKARIVLRSMMRSSGA